MANTQGIHIIGLGVAEQARLSDAAQTVLGDADCIIGSRRQLHTIKDLLSANQQKNCTVILPPLSKLQSLLDSCGGKRVVVLASGDPLYYGIGRWFLRHMNNHTLTFHPAISSIQAACHQLGLSLQDVEVLSLHGRPVEKIRTQLHGNKQLVILTDQNSQPPILAQECMAAGFEQSTVIVCENLGGQQQRVRSFSAVELADNTKILFDPLHITVIGVAGKGGVLPEFPGIADARFATGAEPGKGMISKREARLAILSLLQPTAQDVIWDIGAGCGGVTVELAYWNERLAVYAIEHNKERLQYLAINCRRFGVTHNVNIISGRAPGALADLPAPNKIFIGGSDGQLDNLLARTWRLLPVDGVLVASAVLATSKQQLQQFAENLAHASMESVEIAVTRGECNNDGADKSTMSYHTKLPVTIFRMKKIVAPE